MKYLYTQKNGNIVIDMENGTQCSINEAEYPETWKEVQAYLADHPDAVQPEPLPPPPSDAQLEAAAEAQRQALFREYDVAILMLTRAERLGDVTATAKIAAWDVYAVALQEVNDEPGWYKAPVWPDKPGV